jgi:hypothetical protein
MSCERRFNGGTSIAPRLGAQSTASVISSHDGPESFNPLERCLSRGALGSMLPVGNTNGNEIIQAPGFVVLRNEMVHETRVIPVNGRPHLGAKIRSYMGDPRGRWGRPDAGRRNHQLQR